ncbi:hypothetical protein [Algibacter mikhailovii]|uniref:hypothetical protein n=1 Tax=Algibacter mikhailovii TaxID=425498 RepID=UPI0024952D3E|nr:hypothetical protein [Algibacter mikhailovii]
MKNKLIYLGFVMAFITAFTACSRTEYEAPNSFADVNWYTTAFRQEVQGVGINDYASFSDLSQGAISHTWTIEESSAFLKGPIKNQDSVYEQFIIEPRFTESTDNTVHVLFTESGIRTIRLYNVFNDSVSYRGADDFVFPAKEEDGKWIIDTTFVVDVYDTIVPQILIRQNGIVVPHESETDVITVEAGSQLEFVDVTTTGRPNTRVWNVAGITNLDSLAVIQLNQLGEFKGNLNLSRQGPNIPGDFENYKIPATFNVIPSSLPFKVTPEDIVELENQTIVLPFSGEFAPITVDPSASFTVTVNGTPFTIASTALNPSDATKLEIKLQDQIYRSDAITVSYDGTAALESADTRIAETFTDLPVSMFQHEVIKFDFDDGGVNWTPEAGNLPTTAIEVSSEQAASGSNSLKIAADEKGNWSAFENIVDVFTLEAGVQIQYEYNVYKAPGTSINFLAPWINNAGGTVTQFWHNLIQGVADETWTTIRAPKKWAPPATGNDFYVYFRHNGSGTIYIDDLRILIVDDRP